MGSEERAGPSTPNQPLRDFLSAILGQELGRIPTGRRTARSRRRTPWRPYEPLVDPLTNPTEDEEDVSRAMLMLDGHLPLPMAPPPPRPPRAPQPQAARNRKRRADTVTKKASVNTKRARGCNGSAMLAPSAARVAATAGGGLVNYLAGPMTTTATATTALAEVQAAGQGTGNNTSSSTTSSTTQGSENNNSISNTMQDANAQNVTVYNWCLQSRPQQQKYHEPLPSSCKTQHAIQRSILPEDSTKARASHQPISGVFPPVWVSDPWSARTNFRSADGSRMVVGYILPGGSKPQRKRPQLVSVPVPPGRQTTPMVFLPGVGALPSGTRQAPLQMENRRIINDKPKICGTLGPLTGPSSVQLINQGGRPRLRDVFHQNHLPIGPQVAHAPLGQYFEGRDVINPIVLCPSERSKLLSAAGFSHAQGQVRPRISFSDLRQGISHVNHAGYRD